MEAKSETVSKAKETTEKISDGHYQKKKTEIKNRIAALKKIIGHLEKENKSKTKTI